MDRLTAQYGKNHAVPTKFDLDFVFRVDKDVWDGLTNIFDRLDAYEKTGLMPDEIPQLQSEVERLTKENVALQCENNVLQGSFDRISVKGINMEEKYKQQIAMLKKALELEARHMVSLVSTSDCKMKENSEYCSSTISCTECIQQHFIKQAQQLTDGDASESGDPHV